MSISLYAKTPKPTVPNSAVASKPVNPIVISSSVIAPTEAVKLLGAVNGTPISGIIDPTEVVAPTPVGVNTCASLTANEPTPDVVESPVSPITSAGVIAPTEEVAPNPVKPTTSSVGSKAPTLAVNADGAVRVPVKSIIGSMEPTLDVKDNPVNPTASAGDKTKVPHACGSPHSPLPQLSVERNVVN